MDTPVRRPGAGGQPNTISVAELIARCAGDGTAQRTSDESGHAAAVSVAALLRREGRGPHAAPGRLRPRGHPALFPPTPADPGTHSLRKAAIAACALFAVGAVIAPSVLHDAITTSRAGAGPPAQAEASGYAAGKLRRVPMNARGPADLPPSSPAVSIAKPAPEPRLASMRTTGSSTHEPERDHRSAPATSAPAATAMDRPTRSARPGAHPGGGRATPPGLVDNPGHGAQVKATPPGQAKKAAAPGKSDKTDASNARQSGKKAEKSDNVGPNGASKKPSTHQKPKAHGQGR